MKIRIVKKIAHFLGNLLLFFGGRTPCCSGVCFNLLRGLFFPLMAYRHAIRRIYFLLLREFILTHALHRRTACCSCTLNVSCFRKSLVVHAHRARPRLPSCKRLRSKECPMRKTKWRYATTGQQETAKRVMSSAQTKMAVVL